MELVLIFTFGAIGGITRGVVGFSKYISSYKNVTFSWKYFATTVGISAVVGVGIVWAVQSSGIHFEGVTLNPAVGFILGYAGGDVLENLYKILIKKPILGPVESILKAADVVKKK